MEASALAIGPLLHGNVMNDRTIGVALSFTNTILPWTPEKYEPKRTLYRDD